MNDYENNPRYEKIEDYTYYDLHTEETVFVLSPEERALALRRAQAQGAVSEDTHFADEENRPTVDENHWDSEEFFELACRSFLGTRVIAKMTSRQRFLANLANSRSEIVRRLVASNPNTPPLVLEDLAHDEDESVRNWVMKHPNTPEALRQSLSPEANKDEQESDASAQEPSEIEQPPSNQGNEVTESAVARNPSTPAKVLETLAVDDDWEVRSEVAGNPSTPAKVLATLAIDDEEEVRIAVAVNPGTPAASLETLARDEEELVRQFVASHPNTPLQVLEILSRDDDEEVRENVAMNPHISSGILEILSSDENGFVRLCVAEYPQTPLPVLKSMLGAES